MTLVAFATLIIDWVFDILDVLHFNFFGFDFLDLLISMILINNFLKFFHYAIFKERMTNNSNE